MNNEESRYEVFRECVSDAIAQKAESSRKSQDKRKPKGRKRETSGASKANDGTSSSNSLGTRKQDPEELADFIDVIRLIRSYVYARRRTHAN